MKPQRLKGKVKRSETIKVRCAKLEKIQIEKLASASNLPVAVYMRKRALNYRIRRKFTQKEIEAISTLSRYNSALIRISNLIKARQPNLVSEIEQLVENIQVWYDNLGMNDR